MMSEARATKKPPRPTLGAVGQIVETFRLGEMIGAGGFGEVWRAQEEIEGRAVGSPCALKLLRVGPAGTPSSGSDGRRSDWVKEIDALKSVGSPAIPATLGGGIDKASGLAFIAMQLLRGETLAVRIGRRRIGWRRALAIVEPIAAALDAAHTKGLVHRDLKPQNVFLDTSEGRERVYVIDWGIAVLTGASASSLDGTGGAALARTGAEPGGSEVVTRETGTADFSEQAQLDALALHQEKRRSPIGTPGYIAPEVYDGDEPSGAADAYALGVVLYQAIAGCLPYRLAPPSAATGASAEEGRLRGAELWKATVDGTLVPLDELVADVPAGVLEVVTRLLSRDPGARGAGSLSEAIAFAGRFPHGVPDPPYAGFDAFGADRAALLFGREAHVQRIARRLEVERALVLSGPSGCGKSSLAIAGVGAWLDRSLAQSTDGWRVEVVRPSEAGSLAVGDAAGAVVGGGPLVGTLVVVDQLEEVLNLGAAERDAFAGALAALANGSAPVRIRGRALAEGAPVRVLATVREDFEWQVVKLDALRELCETRRCLVTGVDATAARELVEEPAKAMGYAVEGVSAVVDEVEKALAGDLTKLPVVEFALTEWWARREVEAKRLPAAAWRDLGGVDGALSYVADRFYRTLEAADQAVLHDLFQLLIRNDRKRPVAVALLESEGMRAMCEELAKLRLVTLHEERDGQRWYELAHESLAKRWEVLKRWIAEAALENALLADLEDEARLWVRQGKPEGRLRGEVQAAIRLRGRLDAGGREYVDACVEAARAEEERAEAARKDQEREKEAQERAGRKRLQVTTAVAVAVALVVGAAAIVAVGQRNAARSAEAAAETARQDAARNEEKAKKNAAEAEKNAAEARTQKAAADRATEAQKAEATKHQEELSKLEGRIEKATLLELERIRNEVRVKRGVAPDPTLPVGIGHDVPPPP